MRTFLGWLSAMFALGACLFSLNSARGDLLLQWGFDEATSGMQNAINRGTVAGLEGVFNGGSTRTSNTPGGASPAAADLLPMDNGYVTATDPSALDGLEQITITAWINIQGDPANGSVNNRIAALQDGTAAFNGFSFNVNAPLSGDYGADNFRLGMFVGGTTAFAFGYSDDVDDFFGVPPGEWLFVATTYDGLSDIENLHFYLGSETEEAFEHFLPVTAAAGPIAPVAPGTGFHLGRTDAAPTANTSLEGFIDDVRIYDEILTLEGLEMVRMEGLVAPPPPPDLAGDYNASGRVEQADLDLVLLNWGASLAQPWVEGTVDQAELDAVLLNWGNEAALGGATSVPEPATTWLAALAAGVALLSRRVPSGRASRAASR